MFWKKKESAPRAEMVGKIPTIRTGICTGEQVAGFKDPKSGKFTEVMLIRDDRDMKAFLKTYGIAPEDIRREW